MSDSREIFAKARILIVDDESSVRELLFEALRKDFDCSVAANADETLDAIRISGFDLVLSDIDLGTGKTGTDLVPEILRISPDTVVVMISGNQGIDNAIEAMRAGAFDYIKKPFDLDYLDIVVRRAYAHHLLLAEKRRREKDLEHLIRQRTEQLNYLSFYDPLTDLPNRALFEDRVTQALIAANGASKISLILLSIDGFRKVQQTLGHANSDQMLAETGRRLQQGVGQRSTVSRYERDEFAVLVTNSESEEDLADMAREISESLKRPFMLDSNEVVLTCSIGISISPSDGSDLSTLMKNAAAALARSKEQGGDSVRFYTGDMNARALKRLTLETGLRRAIERQEFEVYYQPKVDIYSGKICGSEALVRWHHPEIGLVSPLEFIPLAEETGLILPLGEWVLSTAVAQTKKWNDEGYDLSVAVNLSVRQLQHTGLAATVLDIVEKARFEPQMLNLEITESSVIQNAETASASLWQLKEKGIQVSLDDFGTGYSSLSYLKKLPIDVIKIDKSFINELPHDADDAALTIAIISLGHNLRLRVVAEGVETEEQLQFLQRLGCDEYQGFYFSKPVAAPDFEILMRAHAIRHPLAVC
jgi:diguanylate cyclase (GGDEF)-like protein